MAFNMQETDQIRTALRNNLWPAQNLRGTTDADSRNWQGAFLEIS